MVLRVPEEAESGTLRILQNGAQSNAVDIKVGTMVATGVHMVANPAIDREGNIYVTLSGPRGQETPVSVFRVGARWRNAALCERHYECDGCGD